MMNENEKELSELDIESRTWNKLQENIKSVGFREGAAKGKELSLQKGFDLGYLEGFKLGECFGNIRGILSGESMQELTVNKNVTFNEGPLSSLSSEACILCSKERILRTSSNDEMPIKKFEDLISMQQCHSSKMMKTLNELNLCDLKSYLIKDSVKIEI